MHPPQAAVPAAPADPPSLYDLATLYDRVVRPGPCEAFYRDLARAAAAADPRLCSSSPAARAA